MRPRTNRALILLFCLAISLQLLETYYYDLFPNRLGYTQEQIAQQKEIWEKEAQLEDSLFRSKLRFFNPNTADSIYWVSIGVSPSLAQNWQSYLKSGGYFRSSSDLLRLYGMDSLTWLRISDFLTFPQEPSLRYASSKSENLALKLQRFNPNEVSEDVLKEMGIPASAIKGIVSYREKYKPFVYKEDLLRVYGLDSSLAVQLAEWVEMPQEKIEKEAILPLDLNSADTSALTTIKGLGRFRAQRIVDWRIRLGGFHSVAQLQELRIADSILLAQIGHHLYCSPLENRLNLNRSSFEELQAHPYINYYLARNIVNFRERLRAFKKVDELMNIELVDDVLFSKLAPYLEVSTSDSIK